MNRIEKDIYADDLVTGGNPLDDVRNVKKESAQLFQKGGFILHKSNSNVSALESNNVDAESELTYLKKKYLVTMKVKLRY